jgi:GTP-binding protein
LTVLDATFVMSAAAAADVPRSARPQVALVGRSNVGKSSLINALTRSRVARTSAAPGKTRLANVYRVGSRGPHGGRALFLVDLPGYGYARGGEQSAREFDRLTAEYFNVGRVRPAWPPPGVGNRSDEADSPELEQRPPGPEAALLLVDSRHPGLETDLEAWRWLSGLPLQVAVVATKIDKLGRATRLRAIRDTERSFNSPVLPVSAATGEGMEPLWKLIVRLVSPHPSPEHQA